jgi:hypothetical protein
MCNRFCASRRSECCKGSPQSRSFARAGDDLPKSVFPSYVGRPKHVRVMAGAGQRQLHVCLAGRTLPPMKAEVTCSACWACRLLGVPLPSYERAPLALVLEWFSMATLLRAIASRVSTSRFT